MGHALVGGLIRSSWATAEELAVVEPLASAGPISSADFRGSS